jgi:hypothetical protein
MTAYYQLLYMWHTTPYEKKLVNTTAVHSEDAGESSSSDDTDTITPESASLSCATLIAAPAFGARPCLTVSIIASANTLIAAWKSASRTSTMSSRVATSLLLRL